MDNKLKHIVQFSGGKDSTAMLLMMLEKNMQVDEIIFCDTGKEFPQMYRHLQKVEKYIGYPITRLKSEKSFDYYMFEHERTKGKRVGQKGYGWCSMSIRWCTSALKRDITKKYLNRVGDYISYIGIAYDEPHRHHRKPKNVKHPLYDWKITEKMALDYCYKHGFDWEGLYEKLSRVSCWCCPLQGIKDLRSLRKNFPDLWTSLLDMDKRSNSPFNKNYSVMDLEKRFAKEDSLNLKIYKSKKLF